MPQKNRPHLPAGRQHLHDPLSACLDADGTYICTAYNSRCYIIQKVTSPVTANLNPDADVFESKSKQANNNKSAVKNGNNPANNSNSPVNNNNNTSTKNNNSKAQAKAKDSYEMVESDFPPLESRGNVYMNGDVGKVPSGAVFTASPEPHPPTPTPEFSLLNGISEVESGTPGGLDSLNEGGAGSASDQSADPQPPIPLDQLKQMLSSQLEYYFSRENLANDTYLLSQMDNDQYVPIWTVANFNQVKKLTTDIKLITEVLRESPNVQVDDEGVKVRPNHKRCIVILREIPDSTPLEEVKGLFSGRGCPKLISCEFAHNNSWYVTFENDEDAQKAYRFLREEVREFQGKPIMARIKAKPMNRLPLPAGIGPGGMALKNGYRTPPAPATTGPGVFEPTPFPQPAQRYLFSNGSSLPHNVNYTNQVQIYVSNFQQHQPFYPPSMLPTWGPTSPAYFDIGSVFSVNGLAPQGGPFTKSHTTRFTPRNSRQKKGSGLEARTAMSDSGIMRKPMSSKENARFDGPEVVQRHEDDSYRPLQPKDQVLPPRRRRKEDEGGSRTSGSPGPQFDLEADAFPPLPGGQAGGEQPPAATPSTAGSPSSPPTAASDWPENRLSDVVKGSVKGRLVGGEESSNGSSGSGHEEKEPTSPAHLPSQQSTANLLPPQTPDKVSGGGSRGKGPPHHEKGSRSVQHQKEDHIPATAVAKTDDGPLNGEGADQTAFLDSRPQASLSFPPATASAPEPHLPHSQVELGVVKLSYAQVAQHHHKEKQERGEKVSAREQPALPSQATPAQQVPLPPQQQAPQHHSDDEKKDPPPPFHYQSSKGDGLGSRGRGGSRGAPRRRDPPRQFNSRQRSPK